MLGGGRGPVPSADPTDFSLSPITPSSIPLEFLWRQFLWRPIILAATLYSPAQPHLFATRIYYV